MFITAVFDWNTICQLLDAAELFFIAPFVLLSQSHRGNILGFSDPCSTKTLTPFEMSSLHWYLESEVCARGRFRDTILTKIPFLNKEIASPINWEGVGG
jgi:hypothetical protein